MLSEPQVMRDHIQTELPAKREVTQSVQPPNYHDPMPAGYPDESVRLTSRRLAPPPTASSNYPHDLGWYPEQRFEPVRAAHLPHPQESYERRRPGYLTPMHRTSTLHPDDSESTYHGPTPSIPDFITGDPSEFTRLKIALENLLPPDATELFRYQILMDHLRLDEACLVADSYLNSPFPYSDTMAALTERHRISRHDQMFIMLVKFGVPSVPENVKVFDESGTEVDDDVFEDVVRDPSVGVLTIKHGADLGSASPQASHGQSNQFLSSSIDSSDSQDTVIIEESSSSKRMRLDDEAKKEHYYDGESGTGYLAWRIKTIQRGLAKERRASFEGQGTSAEAGSGGPTIRRQSEFNPQTTLSEDECKEAIAFMSHSSDEDAIKKKMKLTFDYRRNMVLDPMQSSDTLTVFPRFKDIKGLIEQDFVLMFGEGVSGKLLEKWTTAFKKKVIQQCKKLPSTSDLEELLLAAESPTGWDSDLSSIILLLHLIPPSAQGRKRPGKSGTNIEEHLREITSVAQPYLLAVGPQKNSIHQYFIILDRHAIPCKSTSSLGAIDELFKAHFVFGTSYNIMLHNMYTFIQTTVYNIDVGKVKESPRVAEVSADQCAHPVSSIDAKLENRLGCTREFVHRVHVRPGVQPVQLKLRQLPFSIRNEVSKELQKLIQQDVIKPVDASEWVSPIVVSRKKDGGIRLYVDLREANKAVVVDSFPLPHMEEMFANLVPYGLASAPSCFQRMMSEILNGQSGAHCYLDDILVAGATLKEHDKNLQVMLQRIDEAGLKLNMAKCNFSKTELSFLGHTLSEKGLQPDASHVSAVSDAPPPVDEVSLRSFLGLTSWYSKFIPNYTAVVGPLRVLLRGSTPFIWSPDAQESFETVKGLIVNSAALALFNPELPTLVTTDASDYGIGCVLTQIHTDNTERTVAFASRSPLAAERKYSTVEKEALACVWATERWRTYLWGRHFTLRTDHSHHPSVIQGSRQSSYKY
ncbi:hypothetical protein ROHU_017098 [Labeo rohita]|uniref:ribonuclease H n=1 Tax=Labeo rohita TaxID=84645 RepID=A0A498NI28_LABRO|nr:hypothetical protein ROHU_017098 [Labeo rohita]